MRLRVASRRNRNVHVVAEGQSVARGEVLIELESRDERAALAQAQAAVAQAPFR